MSTTELMKDKQYMNLNNVGRTIPMDLFPHRVEHINEEWAKQTFKYFHLFDDNINYTSFDNDSDDILKWLETANKIVNDLKSFGVMMGEQQVVTMAQTRFGLKMIGTANIDPTSVNDVLSIYENKWFYIKNREEVLKQVYSMTYGLGRNGTNGWALAAERHFMKKINVAYGKDMVTKKAKKRHIGCFYQYIMSRFSKSNTQRFQKLFETNYQEFIMARKKKSLLNKGYTFEWLNLGDYGAWLVRKKDFVETSVNNQTTKTLIEQGECWAKECVRQGYSVDFLKDKIELWTKDSLIDNLITNCEEGE